MKRLAHRNGPAKKQKDIKLILISKYVTYDKGNLWMTQEQAHAFARDYQKAECNK